LDRIFQGTDLVLPALEDQDTLDAVEKWRDHWSSPPVAFDFGAFRVSRDKRRSKRLFNEMGVPSPLPHPEAPFPLVVKPADRSGSEGVRIVRTAEELRVALDTTELPVIEEHCPGPSYSLEVTGRPGDYRTWLTTRLEMDEVFDCRRVTAPADIPEESDRELRSHALALAETLGLAGIMDIEIIATPKGMKVLEIDARLPSQTPACVFLSSGENLVERLAGLFSDEAAARRPIRQSDPIGAVYEHLALDPDGIRSTGEHRLASAGPLRLEDGFLGADYALVDPKGIAPGGVVTLLASGRDLPEAMAKRDEAVARISKRLGL
jgi:pyrrolysine biosynthesis protein PylC